MVVVVVAVVVVVVVEEVEEAGVILKATEGCLAMYASRSRSTTAVRVCAIYISECGWTEDIV